jgi:hypothetical protein
MLWVKRACIGSGKQQNDCKKEEITSHFRMKMGDEMIVVVFRSPLDLVLEHRSVGKRVSLCSKVRCQNSPGISLTVDFVAEEMMRSVRRRSRASHPFP